MLVLPIFLLSPLVSGQLSLYASWTPSVIRYCETLNSTNTSAPFMGGVTCGYSSYNAMSAYYSIGITSQLSLGLINVGWMTTMALSTESGFWKTCKSYMVRVFDGLYNDLTSACALTVNGPTTLPSCNDTAGNMLYRSGSGYCMKEKVCGATALIDFLAGPANSSVIYSWETTRTTALVAAGYTKVGVCYGYGTLSNSDQSSANLQLGDSFY
ncbi:unnamed protein product [Caenorhabditis sp. 36 PRJEB53466]|nr:unnamed protein product [Caenorhabditis sp. 36 PRJEB53466]